MSGSAKYSDWSQVMTLIANAAEQDKHQSLLTMLMTPDEREALIARVNICHELLQGELSQRQISQLLGVGVATITRGSNELKSHTQDEKEWLMTLLQKSAQDEEKE
ncbi:trp operon repressor [Aliivibrio sp. S4TY2]|uniref:Trp operon repressor homolog n=1 Tax=Aliivibrio finisterrensis TaxID=511998 RepID=A0A4Q5KXS6_9GAMM|nr:MULTISPECIES: trp operon repressor [Aliivibrio]MDD9157987.1 trp operon repressor [Aliivibrio sp. S4TY2]MDD9162261.1 trp operon repressor [Aliivibrio sp. S4TY1]MDD9166299.1 trp operon repressor [Aliivibrio sp. S4MY2]MDD9170283.1 trp operon repressor [Aliivibrio sp. S4MY4]MDD9177012.1 trp operon repressor [Aliivibrio sp. S3TY1]